MRRVPWLIAILLLPLVVSGCAGKPAAEQTTDTHKTDSNANKQTTDATTDTTIPDGNSDKDNQDGQSDNNNQLPETVQVALPSGGGLTNIAGKAQGSRYKLQILGGAVSGGAKGSQNKLQMSEGSWK